MNLTELIGDAERQLEERTDIMKRESMSGAWAEDIQANDDWGCEIVEHLARLDITEVPEPHAHWCLKHSQPWDSSEPVCEEYLGITRYHYPPTEEIECELGALYAVRVKEDA